LLGGGLEHAQGTRRVSEYAKRLHEKYAAKLEAFERFAEEIDMPPARIAMAWLLSRPAVTSPIIGPRTMAQLEDMIGLLGLHLSEDVLARLENICPGPGGPAPEAYAW
jgi:aryl-alcohol dehydrogenase-like predicted oxidoreductase